jgi:hypothetical protein
MSRTEELIKKLLALARDSGATPAERRAAAAKAAALRQRAAPAKAKAAPAAPKRPAAWVPPSGGRTNRRPVPSTPEEVAAAAARYAGRGISDKRSDNEEDDR